MLRAAYLALDKKFWKIVLSYYCLSCFPVAYVCATYEGLP